MQINPATKIDNQTGLPTDENGHLLDAETGEYFTDPYGSLEFVHGGDNDFWCFDYAIVDSVNGSGKYLVLHSVYNTETGADIGDVDYMVLPLTSSASWAALGVAFGGYDDVRHNVSGRGQDWWYFYRSVALAVAEAFGTEIPRFSNRQKRFGGKRIDAFIRKLEMASNSFAVHAARNLLRWRGGS